jgi:hypothetical protein
MRPNLLSLRVRQKNRGEDAGLPEVFHIEPTTGWLRARQGLDFCSVGDCRERPYGRGLDPEAYLADIIRQIPTTPATEMHTLMPAA